MAWDAVVFDLFRTLTVDQTVQERHGRQAETAETLGVPVADFLLALRHSFTERACGMWGTPAESLKRLCGLLGVSPSSAAVDAAVRQRADAERFLARPRSGAVELLTALDAASVPVGVLSDCTAELVSVWRDLPYASLVTAAVFSCEIGVRKPDQRMYDAVCHRLSREPTSVIYVGDGGSQELTGARQAGMRAVLLCDLSLLDTSGELRYDAETSWDGEHVNSMAELANLLSTSGVFAVS